MYSWQDAIALLLVLLAVASLARRGWRTFFKRAPGCGGCGGCPAASSQTEPIVTSIAAISPEPRRGDR